MLDGLLRKQNGATGILHRKDIFEGSEEEERAGWTEYYESVKNLPDEVVRWKYEIECDGVHIGWICSYTDLGYMDYLKAQGHRSFYTQTWSGNLAMVRVAEKLGFKEVCRKTDDREVNGKK